MKAFQRWRASNGTEKERIQNGNGRAKSKAVSSKGAPSSSSSSLSNGNHGPLNILYPTNGDTRHNGLARRIEPPLTSPSKDGSVAIGSSDMQRDASVSSSQQKSSSTPNGSATREPSSFYSPSRIRFDSLISRQGTVSTMPSQQPSTTTPSTTSKKWGKGKQIRSNESGDVTLPEDLRAIPKLRTRDTTQKKEENVPLFVVGNARQKTAPLRKALDVEAIKSAENDKKDVSAAPISAPAVLSTVQPSQNVSKRSEQPPSFSLQRSRIDAVRANQNNARKSSAHGYTGMHSPNVDGSLALSPLPIDMSKTSPALSASPFHPGSRSEHSLSLLYDQNEGQNISRKNSTLSLRLSRGRLSGMLGGWNKNSSGTLSGSLQEDRRDSSGVEILDSEAASPSRSQSLANELNDLAVAFEEGLLGEEEYRMLRKGVFDKMMGQGEMEVPKESTLRASQTSPADLSAARNDDSGVSYMASTRSKQSKYSDKGAFTPSLFRSRSSRNDERQSTDRSLKSVGTGSIRMSRGSTQEQLALQENFLQARKARTLRGAASLSMLDGVMTAPAISGEKDADSQYRTTSGARSAITNATAGGGLSITSGSALLGTNYAEKSSQEIEAEIAVVEAEGRRIVENFKLLEVQAIGRHKLTFDQIRRAVDGIEDEVQGASPNDVRDGFVMVASTGDAKKTPSLENSATGKNRISSMMAKRRNPSASDLSRATQPHAKPVSNPYPPQSRSGQQAAHIVRVRRSSLRDNRSIDESAHLSASSSSTETDLRRELLEIHRRKAEVAKKYEDRVAFLQSAVRSAKIRERIR